MFLALKSVKLFPLFLLMTFLVTAVELTAFGQIGHRVSGAIAEQYLTEQAAQKLARILDGESLAEASTYIDEMRSHPDEFWQKTASPYHYVTVPKGRHYSEIKPPKEGDAVTALNHYSSVLKNPKSSQSDKALAVKFIVHIIADLHQPLHAGNGTDRGGNDFKVEFFWEKSNLHRVWDSGLIDRQQLSYSEWTAWLKRTITTQKLTDWAAIDPNVWINESVAIRQSIYPESNKLSWDYQFKNLPIIKMRLQQAGVRIAFYLNHQLK